MEDQEAKDAGCAGGQPTCGQGVSADSLDHDAIQKMRDALDYAKGGKLYIGSKLIRATPMDEVAFILNVKKQGVDTDRPTRDGYKVTYPDGYVSWSPKTTFEEAYREVSAGERKML